MALTLLEAADAVLEAGRAGDGPRAGEGVLVALVGPELRIISLTVTEKGYCYDAVTKELDAAHPDFTGLSKEPAAQPLSAAELRAVVRREDEDGVAREPFRFERVEQSAQLSQQISHRRF